MVVKFLDLPAEVIHGILARVEPADLAHLKGCCRTINDFVKSDVLLYKHVFLNNFDDPRLSAVGTRARKEPPWEAFLYKYTRFGKIVESNDIELKKRERFFLLDVFEQLLLNRAEGSNNSRNTSFLNDRLTIEDAQNKETLIHSSTLFEWAETGPRKDPSRRCSITSPEAEFWSMKDLNPMIPLPDASFLPPDVAEKIKASKAEAESQKLSAKIHCLYGVPAQEYRSSIGQTNGRRYSLRNDTAPLHPYVRSRVYDLRQHTKNDHGSYWGPFMSNQSHEVDWEKMEAIMCLLHYNMSKFARNHGTICDDAIPDWSIPFKGTAPGSYGSRPVDIPLQPPVPLEAQDPYNVTGTWMRVVCFLDYSEFYEFNFRPNIFLPDYVPRPPLDREEATRLITMRIQITDITPPGPDDGQDLPVVHFRGTSSSVRPSAWDGDAHSDIRGVVKLTPQGEVHWTTWSIFNGEERWRSEGVQVGGPRSGRGVFGFWFDKDFDIHGPAGPTAFWKSHDGIEIPKPASAPQNNALHALHVPLY